MRKGCPMIFNIYIYYRMVSNDETCRERRVIKVTMYWNGELLGQEGKWDNSLQSRRNVSPSLGSGVRIQRKQTVSHLNRRLMYRGVWMNLQQKIEGMYLTKSKLRKRWPHSIDVDSITPRILICLSTAWYTSCQNQASRRPVTLFPTSANRIAVTRISCVVESLWRGDDETLGLPTLWSRSVISQQG